MKLPNASMRDRILRVMLKDEQLADDFDFGAISGDPVTQGFSGSDLRNVCIAAAYKPLRDYLAQASASTAPLCVKDLFNLPDIPIYQVGVWECGSVVRPGAGKHTPAWLVP